VPQLAARNVSIPRAGKSSGLEHFEDMKPHGAATYLPKISGFTQQQLSDGKPATQPTDVYLGYDLIRLYVVWVAGIHHIHPMGLEVMFFQMRGMLAGLITGVQKAGTAIVA
jgi:hypothetical protein